MKVEPRICHRCGTEMTEKCYPYFVSSSLAIRVDSQKLFDPSMGTPYIAVCPNCGEISWYIPPQELHKLKD